jgi:uncharacterized protein (DUF1810 family)
MTTDPFDLQRFLTAQEGVYETALAELRGGRKRTHWMWFVFPQFHGLGASATSRRYAIRSLEEARAYLDHLVLGARLRECADALLAISGLSASDIFDYPDDLKLRSSMTLFELASPPASIFGKVLKEYFGGVRDEATIRLATRG